jgi:hypothetical protein
LKSVDGGRSVAGRTRHVKRPIKRRDAAHSHLT